MAKKEKYERFSAEEVPDLFELSNALDVADYKSRLVSATHDLADRLVAEISNCLVSQNAMFVRQEPNVVLRVETVRILLSELEKAMGSKVFRAAMKRAGARTGYSFFWLLYRYLNGAKRLPESYAAFLKFWASWDGRAGWGRFSVAEFEENRLVIDVHDGFVTRAVGHEAGCEFFGAYVVGLLDAALSFIPRWLGRHRRQFEAHKRVHSIKSARQDGACRLDLRLVDGETTPIALDNLFAAFQAADAADAAALGGQGSQNAILAARSAIEHGLAEPFCSNPHYRISYDKALKKYKKKISSETFLAYSRSVAKHYGTLSDRMHMKGPVPEIDMVIGAINEICAWLSELQRGFKSTWVDEFRAEFQSAGFVEKDGQDGDPSSPSTPH